MAKIYADATGFIVRVLDRPELEKQYPDPPPEAAAMLEFDEDTNGHILDAIRQNYNGVRLVGGKVTQNGQEMVVNAEGTRKVERRRVRALLRQVETSWTQDDVKFLVKWIVKQLDRD